jgi:transcriptional regulator with GAF, ATPase, and Fis domain
VDRGGYVEDAAQIGVDDHVMNAPNEEPAAACGFGVVRAIEDRRRARRLAADLATRLMTAPRERIDETIRQSLEILTRTLGAGRCGLAQFADDGRSLVWKHGYAMPGIRAWTSRNLAAFVPWFTRQVREGRRLVLSHLPGDLPPEASVEADLIAAAGLKSCVTLPLKAGNRIIGSLGVHAFDASLSWTTELVSSLELVASAFANALQRQHAEEELERTRAALELSRKEIRELQDSRDAEAAHFRREARQAQGFDEIVGASAALSQVLHDVERAAAVDTPVLILGETGTGKDLVARAIHDRGRRRERPLIAVNCAALPDALIESELFGYEKGAFTGAVARTLGRFEVASGGSILLDEIGELPLSVQAKLLRVLDGGSFERLGSSKTVQVDVRVMAATNRDLEKEVREGRFRADLYYRLNVFPITIPPLRERPEDVPLLVWHFINARQAALGRAIERVPDRLMRALETYSWPGNVRELENVIERALIVTTGSTLAFDARFLETAGETQPLAGPGLDDVQRAHIVDVLRQCGWKVAGKGNAAERLGLKRGTLQGRMKKLGIRRPEKEA